MDSATFRKWLAEFAICGFEAIDPARLAHWAIAALLAIPLKWSIKSEILQTDTA